MINNEFIIGLSIIKYRATHLNITAMRPIWTGPDLPQRIKDADKKKMNVTGYILFLINGHEAEVDLSSSHATDIEINVIIYVLFHIYIKKKTGNV